MSKIISYILNKIVAFFYKKLLQLVFEEAVLYECTEWNVSMMADSVGCLESYISTFVNNRSDKQEVKCIGCSELRLELLQVKTEILSFEKIMKMLQEQLNMKRATNNDKSSVQGNSADECFKIHSLQGGWTQSSSKNYKKNYDLNSNQIQLVPASQNRLEVLSNLKEDVSVGVLLKDDKIQILNSCSNVKGINQSARSVKTGDCKVLLIGNSHARLSSS
jgi:hypothetical protein